VNDNLKRHELERAHGVTWAQLVELEPRLNELLWKARESGSRCRCREEVSEVFSPFRNAVAELVGFRGPHRDHPVLGSGGAYEVAYWRLYEAVTGLLPRPSADKPAGRRPGNGLYAADLGHGVEDGQMVRAHDDRSVLSAR
jgi:hypothetical protein